jgi:hypothetical protein
MKKLQVKKQDSLQSRSLAMEKQLLPYLTQLLQETSMLLQRCIGNISILAHASSPPHFQTVAQECEKSLREFSRITTGLKQCEAPIEDKILQLKNRNAFTLQGPILAARLHIIIILHLVGKFGIHKCLEEINAVEKRKKDLLQQFEGGLKMCREQLTELADRLNFLFYMRTCLEKEGVLPEAVMYHINIPEVVKSPYIKPALAGKK